MKIGHAPGCPACGSSSALTPLERHFDRIGGKRYRLLACPECGVVSSEPREPVGAEWYEKAAPIRGRESRPPPEADWRFRQFFSESLPPGKLLDVGCGDGGFMSLAAARGFKPAGFDYDQRVVALAREKGLEDAQAMEFSSFCAGRRAGEFDAITLFDVLEHTPEPGWFLGELKRLLKPGGHVAITLPNALRPIPWGREEHDFPPHHFTRWTPQAMRGFLQRQGFRVLRQEAGSLKVSYLADHFFFYVLMPGLLAGVRRILFGGTASRTITELYQEGKRSSSAPDSGWRGRLRAGLADKLVRQRLVNAFKALCSPLAYALGAALVAFYQIRQRDCGDCLYTLARLESR